MLKRLLWIAALFFLALSAQAQTVSGKHAEKGITCANCHGQETPTKRASVSSCEQCHGNYPALAKRTSKVTPNPHDSHQGDVRCTLCHKTHEPSVLYCNECHQFDLKIK